MTYCLRMIHCLPMTRTLRWLQLLVFALLFSAEPMAARAQEQGWFQSDLTEKVEKSTLVKAYVVNARALNFRGDPSIGNTPVSVLQQGAFVVKVAEAQNDAERRTWFRVIKDGGEEGWVASEYLTPISDMLWTVEGAVKFVNRLGSQPAESAALPALEEIRAGFLYVGPIGDAGWTYAHEQGRKAMDALPFVTKTTYVESVPGGDPSFVMNAIEKLVAEGHNVIFTTSYDHMDPTIEAARRFPDVVFMNCSGFKTERNAGTYFGRMYEARYLSGIVAAAMSKAKLLGYVAALPTPDVVHGINAFALGAQSIDPKIEVKVEWTNTWYGPDIEAEKADLLLDQGADLLAMEQDSPAVIQAAAKRGKYAIGYQSDMSIFAPDATLTSAIFNWAPIYEAIAQQIHEGTWEPDNIWWGMENEAVGLAPLNKSVPETVAQQVDEAAAQIKQGELRVFEGPISDATGKIRVPARQAMSDADLLSMDYFVQGVSGSLPTPAASEQTN